MTFQTSVADDMAWGIPGEQALAGDVRAEPVQLKTVFNGTPGTRAPFGAVALTQADGENGVVSIGGDGVFIGILSSPKQWVAYSALGGNAPGIEAGAQLEATSQTPGMWMELTTSAGVGDAIAYKDDGTLVAAPASTAPDEATLIPGSRVVRFNINTGVAMVSLVQLPTPAAKPAA
ncbi:structural cement protein Gp24 [Scandinavium goeteborgense]|uniref:structural cement protein Gp24 n=1 Tax=Scandinavium goeteborgense TaxID=1851514 RepID=UPI000F66F74F|nr:hypothetical protein [Scandinavium goeteborgense]QKN82073.1 hypothetical protein A8O29_012540 [Scandinavium goeteborgense]